MKHKILIVPDLHFPFHNKVALSRVIAYAKKFQPTHIVQVGDLYDNYSFSKFRRSLNLVTPAKEIKKAHHCAVQMWKELRKVAPTAKCFQLMGNHDARFIKRVLERLPEIEDVIVDPLNKLYEFEGVTTVYDDRDYIIIDNILFTHGYMCGIGKHLKAFIQNVVIGHSHRGHTYFETHKGKTLFELNVGHLTDLKALPLCYTPIKISNSNLGFGVIENNEPKFVAL